MRHVDSQCIHAYFGCDFEDRVDAMKPVVEAAVAFVKAEHVRNNDFNEVTWRRCDQTRKALCTAVREYEEGKK